MKYIYPLLAAICLLFCSVTGFTQKESKKWSIGIFPELSFPLNDAKLLYHYDVGMTLRFSYHLGPGFATISGGGVGFIPKISFADTSNNYLKSLKVGLQLPIKAGYKYIIVHHIFIMAEGGYSYFYSYFADNNSKIQHTSSGGFTYAGTVGVQFSGLEVGCKYEAFQLPGTTISDIGVRLGFNF